MVVTLVIIILDQLTKYWTVQASGDFNPVLIKEIIPEYFNIVDYRNRGAAWGIFSKHTFVLSMVSLAAFLYFIFDFPNLTENKPFRKFAWAILIGGVFGNFIDRFFRGEVVDMFEVFIPMPSFMAKYVYLTENQTYQYPAFNIADAGICVGVFLYFSHIVYCFFKYGKEQKVVSDSTKTA